MQMLHHLPYRQRTKPRAALAGPAEFGRRALTAYNPKWMQRHIPNFVTSLRLLLAAVFFIMLSAYQYEGRGDPTFLLVATALYAVALFTDFLDGYLARRWAVESTFGRIVDPFVDKILVLGSFTFFAGKNFIIPASAEQAASDPMVVKTITGVAPWVVILLLGRELLVTSLRGISESKGHHFGAAMSGKVKMVIQSITIMVILIYVDFRGWLLELDWELHARVLRDVCIWATVIVTVLSGYTYVRRAMHLYRSAKKELIPTAP